MHSWKLLNSKIVFDDWLQIKKDTYELPDGKRKGYTYISNINTAFTLAVTPEKKVVMIEQFRPSTGSVVLDMPGGLVEDGEDPGTAAARELQEETGYTAKKLVQLGIFYLVPGGASSKVHLYFAEVGKPGRPVPEEDELITVKLMEKEDLHTLLDKNETLVRAPLPLAVYLAERKGLL